MDLTPHNQLQQWLILALGQLGGSASRAEALARIEAMFGRISLPTISIRRPRVHSRPSGEIESRGNETAW
jgi:hypothetical protein